MQGTNLISVSPLSASIDAINRARNRRNLANEDFQNITRFPSDKIKSDAMK